jgi:UDP-N-acetylmuramoylalanine--D-glutamate ligase
MKIAILGFDSEGRSSYDYFASKDHDITIHDQNTDIEIPEKVASKLGTSYLDNLDQYDLLVRTAGMPPSKIIDKNPRVAAKITTQINEFLKVCPTKNVIGVTGTKGKGTTSTLISMMLEETGRDTKLGGNIGVPPLSFLPELSSDSWVVLELSSFQLIDLRYSPHLAVCLMVVPEHLNWHKDMQEYLNAKSQLFNHQSPEDIAVYFSKNDLSKRIVSDSPAQKIPYYQPPGAIVENNNLVIEGQVICATDELGLIGAHNWQNACAALTVLWQIDKNVQAARQVLKTFIGLEHRLELVGAHNGIDYYDDSFGTTPETSIVALQSFSRPKVIILGGSDKGADYTQLAQVVATENVRKVVLIGEQADRIKAALDKAGFNDYIEGGETMKKIVNTAHSQAQTGDVVLLSTATASFDMFKNYKARGEQFKQAVQALA